MQGRQRHCVPGERGWHLSRSRRLHPGEWTRSVALADLRGDKKLDIIALNRKDKSMMVLPGIGDGTFGDPQIYTLSANPRAIYVGDLNGDGKADVAIATDCGASSCAHVGNIDVWLGRGDGSVSLASSYPVGFSPVSIAGGDLRGSGHVDLVVGNTCGTDSSCKAHGNATVLFGDGTGKFTSGGTVDLGLAPSSIALGKITGTALDLVVAQRGSNQVAVMAGNGKGGFGTPTNYPVGSAPTSLAIGDFNKDGLQDVAVANFQTSTVSVLYGAGSGALKPATTLSVGAGPESLLAITGAKGTPSSLVTANGNGGATPMGTDITVVPEVGSATATVTITNNPTSSNVDDTVTLSVTVSGTSGTPTGTAYFTSNGTTLQDCGTITLDGTGAGSCTTNSLLAGSDSLVGLYSGDNTYAQGDSSATPVTQTVAALPTTTAMLTSTPNPSGSAQTVTITAQVSPTLDSGGVATVPFSGTMDFQANAADISGCTAQPVDANPADATYGQASCTTTALTSGGSPYTLGATFSGDANFTTSSTTASLTQNVFLASTTSVVLTTGNHPSAPGDTLLFTATVSPVTGNTMIPNTDHVTFTDTTTSTVLCASSPTNWSTSQKQSTATCSTNKVTGLGSNTITATFSGDSGTYAGSSGTVAQAVKETPTVTVTTTGTPSAEGASVTFTVTVTPTSGTTQVTGNVNFTDSVTPTALCTGLALTPTSGGAASVQCVAPSLAGGSHTITASYLGDGTDYNPASNTVTQVVSIPTTTVVSLNTGSVNPSTTDTAVTFLATVTPGNVAGTMKGNVTFTDSTTSTTLCSAVAIAYSSGTGTATCRVSNLIVESHNIVAVFTDTDNVYLSSPTSAAYAQVVNQANTTTNTPTANPSSSTVDGSVTFTATVTVQGGLINSVPLTGSISFFVDGSAITCDSPSNVSMVGTSGTSNYVGSASCKTEALAAGTHSIKAIYNGDSNYNASGFSSSLTGFTVSKLTPGLTLSTAPASNAGTQTPTVDQTVAIKAAFSLQSPAVVPTGTVTFTDTTNGTLCSGVGLIVDGSGNYSATCNAPLLTAGAHSFSASISSDGNYNSANSSASSYTVYKAPTNTALQSSNANPAVNTQITFTATITPNVTPTPTSVVPFTTAGTVTFTADGKSPPICKNVTVTVGSGDATAICQISSLSAGSHSIVAVYSGDGNYVGSTSATFTQSVGTTAANLSMVSADNTTGTSGTDITGAASTVNDSVTFTETVSAPNGGTITPTGKVTFTANSQSIPGCTTAVTLVPQSGTTPPNAKASCSTTALLGGLQTIAAAYTGDTNYGAAANNLAQNVSQAATTTAIHNSGTPTVNSTVTFTDVVTPTAPSGNTSPLGPGGSVTFSDVFTPTGGTVQPAVNICTAVPVTLNKASSNYQAPCSSSTLLAGVHVITGTYTGDSDYLGSTATTTVTITSANATIALTSSLNPSNINLPVTFTASLGTLPAGTVLAGTFRFQDTIGGTTSTISGCDAVAPSVSGYGLCTTSALSLGSHAITVSYNNDNNINASQGTLAQVVNPGVTTLLLQTSSTSDTVNSPISFTASVSEAPGSGTNTAFSGTVNFTANGVTIPTCGAKTVTGAGLATCTTSALVAGNLTIGAAYGNDPNFSASSNSLTEPVSQAKSTTVLTATPQAINFQNPANSNDTVTFTASVTPFTGTVALSGSVTFTTNGGTVIPCSAGSVAFSPSTGLATCTTSSLAAGTPQITATYAGDPNFTSSSNSVTESVQDFKLSVVVPAKAPYPAGTVTVTQGFTSANDPFSSESGITLTANSIASYAGAVGVSCMPAGSAPSGAPNCTLGSPTLKLDGSGTPQVTSIVIDATKATAGTYMFAVTGIDPVTQISQLSNTFTVTVRNVPAAVNIVSGASTGNTATATFQLPATVTLNGFTCPLVAGTGLGTGSVAPGGISLACHGFNPSPAGSSTSTSAQSVAVTVTITTGGTSVTAMTDHHTNIFAAGLLGIPIFGLIGLLRGRKSPKSALYRLVVIAVICVAAFQVLGCGGSFTRQTTIQGATPPGQYYILVQATGSDNNTYQSILLVNVTL